MISWWNDAKSLLMKIIGVSLLSLSGGCVMSADADIQLTWEWPADRATEQRIIVKVEDITAQSGGLFGIKKSPSLANSLPDPMLVRGLVTSDDELISGKTISLVAPMLELGSIKSGSYVVFSIVEKDICICVTPVDSPNVDISKISCP